MVADHWTVRIICSLLFNCFRTLWDLKEKWLNPDPKKGARIYDIAFRFNLDSVILPSSLDFFCLKFKDTVPLSAILDENVYLYTYNSKEVAFIVVEPGKEIWRAKYASFYKQAQNEHAKQMIRLSLDNFFTVCDSLPHPGSKLNFVHSTPRSGSTLTAQIFEETGQCISVSEPEDFSPDPSNLKPGITHEEKLQLFGAIGKYVSRSINNNSQYKWYFAKLIASSSMTYYDILKEVFPESKHIFLYRDLKPSMKSAMQSFCNFPIYQCTKHIVKRSSSAAENTIEMSLIKRLRESEQTSKENLEKMARFARRFLPDSIMATVVLYHYCGPYEFFLNKLALPAMKYEDIVEKRQENVRKVFAYFGLPLDLADSGLKAMEQDSQRNSAIAKKNVGAIKEDALDDAVIELAQEFCQMFNVPDFDGPQRHHCTITVPA